MDCAKGSRSSFWKRRTVRLACALLACAPLVGMGDPAYFATKRGAGLYREGKFDEALREYLSAQQAEPEDRRIDYDLGAAYYKLGRYDEAAKSFARAMETQDGTLSQKAAFNRGAALYKGGAEAERAGDNGKAMELFKQSAGQYKKILRRTPGDDDARHNLELALAKIKETEQKQKQQKESGKKGGQGPQDEQGPPKSGERKDKKPQDAGQDQQKEKDRKKSDKPGEGDAEKKQDSQEAQDDATRDKDKMDPDQARGLLNAMERDERELKKKIRAKTMPGGVSNEKDW